MNNTPTRSSREENFRPQNSGEVSASGSNENRRKKRPKLVRSDDPTGANPSSSSKPKPARKSNPNAAKIIPTSCSECGKQFDSHKALYGHMRCHPERQWRGITAPPNFQISGALENPVQNLGENVTEELHEVASSLVMLARGSTAIDTACVTMDPGLPESGPCTREASLAGKTDGAGSSSGLSYRFEFSSHKKLILSHQTLGGHRDSHKNKDHNSDQAEGKEIGEEKIEVGHKCSICLKVVSSGQALGGHKRRHWEKGDEQVAPQGNPVSISRVGRGLDLNLPAPIDGDGDSSSSDLALDLRLGS